MADITDSARYLVSEDRRSGAAGDRRLSMAVCRAPIPQRRAFVMQTVVAIAVTSFVALLKRRLYQCPAGPEAFIGSDPRDRKEGSPLTCRQNPGAGADVPRRHVDINVGISHSEDGIGAGAGRKVEFVRYRDLDHQIDDSNAAGIAPTGWRWSRRSEIAAPASGRNKKGDP
jgi:hypothetical protein